MPEMTTAQLDFSGGSLILARPGTGDPTLRAWDAADELLLEEAICAITRAVAFLVICSSN